MLNRRKQAQDPDGQAGDEREPLIETAFAGTLVNNDHYFAPAKFSHKSGGNQIDLNRTNFPLVGLKKVRDGLPGPNNQPFSYTNNNFASTSSSAITIQPFETSITNSPSHSRAIDLPINDPYRSQTSDFVYYTVQPGDTLHNLSVRYSCPVASIKRLNNIWSDQEFFGLTKLKLPAGKLRLIADVINSQKPEQIPLPTTSSTLSPRPTTSLIECRAKEQLEERSNEIDLMSTSSEFLFKDLDQNIAKARSAAKFYDDNASAIMQSLAQCGNIVVDENDDLNDPKKVAQREAQILLNDLSDYGLSYNGLILFIFIVCLICPLAYVIYLEETQYDSSKHS